MKKEHFETLRSMGYSVEEALDLLTPAAAPEEPKPEPQPIPIPSTTTEEKTPDISPEEKEAPAFVTQEAFNASQKALVDTIAKLTKAVQAQNIRFMGTDEDPTKNRADEFIARMISGAPNDKGGK